MKHLLLLFLFVCVLSHQQGYAQKSKKQSLDSRVSQKVNEAIDEVKSKLDSQFLILNNKVDKNILILDKKKIKTELSTAIETIEHKNNEIASLNSWMGWWFGIVGFGLAILGVVISFFIIKPINDQKEQLKKLLEETNSIKTNYENSEQNITDLTSQAALLQQEATTLNLSTTTLQEKTDKINLRVVELEEDSKKINDKTKELNGEAKFLNNEVKFLNSESLKYREKSILLAAESKALNFESQSINKSVTETNEDVKKLLDKSTGILQNIQGTLKDVVEEKYNAYENEQFKKALVLLKRDETCRSVGIPNLKELCALKLPDEWANALIEFLKRDIESIDFSNSMVTNQSDVARAIARIFHNHGKDGIYEEYMAFLCTSPSFDDSTNLYDYLTATQVYNLSEKIKSENIEQFYQLIERGVNVFNVHEHDFTAERYSAAIFLIASLLDYSFRQDIELHQHLLESDRLVAIIQDNNLVEDFEMFVNRPMIGGRNRAFELLGLTDENLALRGALTPIETTEDNEDDN